MNPDSTDIRMRRIRIAAGAVAGTLAVLFIGVSAMQNQAWVRTPFMRDVQSAIARGYLSHVNVVSLPEHVDLSDRLPATQRARICILTVGEETGRRDDRVSVASATEIARAGSDTGSHKRARIRARVRNPVVITTIEPEDLEGKTLRQKRELIGAVDEAALCGDVDVIVESTAADRLRMGAWGERQTQRLRTAGVIRCVVFDGGHHVASLALEPDILLVPVASEQGRLFASHWFTRDSMPAEKLLRAISHAQLRTAVVYLPRGGAPIKNRDGMALLAQQALHELEAHAMKTARMQPGTRQLRLSQEKTRPHFVSVDIDPSASKDVAARRIAAHVKAVSHAYVGVTFGMSTFPFSSTPVRYTMDELEAAVEERLEARTGARAQVSILSEPNSAWDIYRERLGF